MQLSGALSAAQMSSRSYVGPAASTNTGFSHDSQRPAKSP